ncbi:MAG: M48 family metalloprotease [Candidatus Omnitrophica bacterium]|nr:M48 family metalloprotease [Candidatus Omnitrophota bacterium]
MKNILVLYIILLGVLLSGCVTQEYNTATGKQDIMFVSTEKEINMGRSIAKSIENNPDIELDPDPLMTERVINVGNRIASVADRKEVNYTFRVIDKDEVNAFALPGGYIFVYRGLVEKVDSDDELASIIAHEIAHVVARHSIKRLQGGLGYNILQILMVVSGTSGRDAGNVDKALGQLMMSYSREDEALADRLAVRYLEKAGFNPWAMVDFLEKLKEVHRDAPIRPYTSYRSHPNIADRIRMVKQELSGEVDFTDYMNKPVEQLR